MQNFIDFSDGVLNKLLEDEEPSQENFLSCNFDQEYQEHHKIYSCHSENVTGIGEFHQITAISGEHKTKRSDSKVTKLSFENARTKFLPTGLGFVFRNLRFFSVIDSSFGYLNREVFKGMTGLYRLNIENSYVKLISFDAFADLKSLKELTIKHSNVKNFHDDLLANLPDLEVFDASYNRIEDIDMKLFRNNKKLRSIDLSQNAIRTVAGDETSLQGISFYDFARNRCTSRRQPNPFTTCKPQLPLHHIVMGSNNADSLKNKVLRCDFTHGDRIFRCDEPKITGRWGTYFRVTYADGDDEESFDDNKIFFIRELNLQNGVEVLKTFKKLTVEDAARDLMTQISFERMINLEFLEIFDYPAEEIPNSSLANLEKLRSLVITFTGIKRISNELLAPLVELQSFEAKKNQIEHIDVKMFEHNTKLRVIDLSYNRIKTVTGDFATMDRIVLYKNDCTTLSFSVGSSDTVEAFNQKIKIECHKQ